MYPAEARRFEFNAHPSGSDFWTLWEKDFTRRANANYTDRFPGDGLGWVRALERDGYDIHHQVNRTGYLLFRDATFNSLRDEISLPFHHLLENRVVTFFETLFAGSVGSTAEENLSLLPRAYGDNEKLWLASVPPVGEIGYGFRPWNGYAYANARLGSRFATDVRYNLDPPKAGKVTAHLVCKTGRVRLLSGIAFRSESANRAEWSAGVAYDSRQLTCFVGMTRQGSVSTVAAQANLVF